MSFCLIFYIHFEKNQPYSQAHDNNWLNDSGITTDLPIEFGGSSKDEPEFKKIIIERYPDAPDNILELLKEKGIIESDGKIINIK